MTNTRQMSAKANSLKNREIAAATREFLAVAFPACFAAKGQPKRPLKIGIHVDLRAALPDVPRKHLCLALRDYTSGPHYLRNMVCGTDRVDLAGDPAGAITEDAERAAAARLIRINVGMKKRRGSEHLNLVASEAA